MSTTDATVGLAAFAQSLGVTFDTDTHLQSVVQQCYIFCSETISKARVQQANSQRAAGAAGAPVAPRPPRSPAPPHSVSPTRAASASRAADDGAGSPLPPLESPRSPVSAQQPQQPPPPPNTRRDISPSRGGPAAAARNNSRPPSPLAATRRGAGGAGGSAQQPLPPPPPEFSSSSSSSSVHDISAIGLAAPSLVDVSTSAMRGGGDRRFSAAASSSSSAPALPAPSGERHNTHQSRFSEEIRGYARFIGIDPDSASDEYLMPLAQAGFYADLPEGWRKLETAGDGVPYFVGPSGETTFEFPVDEDFRRKVADARRERRRALELDRQAAAVVAAAAASRSGAAASVSGGSGGVSPSAGRAAAVAPTTTVYVPITPHKGIDDRVEAMADYLGIDHRGGERHLLSLAREALIADIPGWQRYHDAEGNVYYGRDDGSSDETTWDLPNKADYLRRIEAARKRVSPAPGVAFAPPSAAAVSKHAAISSASSKQQQQQLPLSSSSSSIAAAFDADSSYSRELLEYAEFLGIPRGAVGVDAELTALAVEGFNAPLPAGWTSYRTANGECYYANESSGVSMYDHPLDRVFRQKVADLKKRRIAQQAR